MVIGQQKQSTALPPSVLDGQQRRTRGECFVPFVNCFLAARLPSFARRVFYSFLLPPFFHYVSFEECPRRVTVSLSLKIEQKHKN